MRRKDARRGQYELLQTPGGRLCHAQLGFDAGFDARGFTCALDEAAHRFGRLRSAFYPVSHPFLIEFETRWIAGVMITHRLDVAAIAF